MQPPSDDLPTNGVAWRLQSLEHRVANIENVKPDVLAERINNHTGEFLELRGEIAALKRALYTFALSITASAIGFAIAVFEVLKK